MGCALPFRTVFAKRLGISATAIGVIFCVVPFIKILTNPLFGFLLDYFKRFRLILSIIMIFSALSHVALTFIPPMSTIPQHKINATEKNFHSHLTYVWTNDSLQSSCNPKLTLNIEYSLSQEFMGEVGSFMCDMQCFKSKNDIPINSIESESQCHMEMKSQFKIFVHVSDCDISIRLGKGQLAVFHSGAQNLLLFEVNNALARKIASSVSPSKNCSSEHTRRTAFSLKSTQNIKMELSNEKQPKENTKGTLDFAVEGENTEIRKSLGSGVKKYYVQNEYIINFYNEKLCMNLCNQEFDCQVKKCSIDSKGMEKSLEQSSVEENGFPAAQFWSFLVLMIISSITLTALLFMMDAVCYELLQDRKDRYGQQRLWGTIGWGVGALIGGCLNQAASNDTEAINYAPSFYLLGVLSVIDLIPLYHLKVTDLKYSSHICKDVCFLFSKIDILYNIFIVYTIGILSGFIWNFQFWFMEEIGSSQVLLGLSQTFDCIFEVPCFFVSGWIIKKIGHDHCNSVTLLCFGLRYLCFAVMYDPWWTLAAGLFNGPTFGLFYASMTMYAKNEARAGTEATVQSLLNLCFEGIGEKKVLYISYYCK